MAVTQRHSIHIIFNISGGISRTFISMSDDAVFLTMYKLFCCFCFNANTPFQRNDDDDDAGSIVENT